MFVETSYTPRRGTAVDEGFEFSSMVGNEPGTNDLILDSDAVVSRVSMEPLYRDVMAMHAICSSLHDRLSSDRHVYQDNFIFHHLCDILGNTKSQLSVLSTLYSECANELLGSSCVLLTSAMRSSFTRVELLMERLLTGEFVMLVSI